jgi:hypothetical protein
MTALLDHAEGYARAGIPVLALRPCSKFPATDHGKDDATTDLDQIRYWWGRNPNYNIGIRPPIGFVVLDEDVQHGGDQALAELCYRHGELPDTWTARTGNGGRHIWLRADPPFRGKLCDGVDIKHHSGYLVAPPSVHPNGRVYTWLNNLPIAYAPHWLAPLLAPAPPRPAPRAPFRSPHAAVDGLVRLVATATEGNRNKALYWAVRTAAAEGTIDRIRDDLKSAAVSAGESEAKAEATINSGIKHVQEHR